MFVVGYTINPEYCIEADFGEHCIGETDLILELVEFNRMLSVIVVHVLNLNWRFFNLRKIC